MNAGGEAAQPVSNQTNLYSFAFGRYLRIMTCSVLLDLDGTLIDSYPGILAKLPCDTARPWT